MRPISFIITLAFGVAIGALVLQFWPKSTPTLVQAPAIIETPTPTPAPNPIAKAKPAAPATAKRPEVNEEMKARFKAFGEETRKLALEIVGGDEKKLGSAIRAGMFTPEGIEVMRKGREIGENFRKAATDEEREAVLAEVPVLRDQAMAQLRVQVAKLDSPAPAATPTPAQPPVPLM